MAGMHRTAPEGFLSEEHFLWWGTSISESHCDPLCFLASVAVWGMPAHPVSQAFCSSQITAKIWLLKLENKYSPPWAEWCILRCNQPLEQRGRWLWLWECWWSSAAASALSTAANSQRSGHSLERDIWNISLQQGLPVPELESWFASVRAMDIVKSFLLVNRLLHLMISLSVSVQLLTSQCEQIDLTAPVHNKEEFSDVLLPVNTHLKMWATNLCLSQIPGNIYAHHWVISRVSWCSDPCVKIFTWMHT